MWEYDNRYIKMHIDILKIRKERSFAKRSKILAIKKVILSNYQNNYVERSN